MKLNEVVTSAAILALLLTQLATHGQAEAQMFGGPPDKIPDVCEIKPLFTVPTGKIAVIESTSGVRVTNSGTATREFQLRFTGPGGSPVQLSFPPSPAVAAVGSYTAFVPIDVSAVAKNLTSYASGGASGTPVDSLGLTFSLVKDSCGQRKGPTPPTPEEICKCEIQAQKATVKALRKQIDEMINAMKEDDKQIDEYEKDYKEAVTEIIGGTALKEASLKTIEITAEKLGPKALAKSMSRTIPIVSILDLGADMTITAIKASEAEDQQNHWAEIRLKDARLLSSFYKDLVNQFIILKEYERACSRKNLDRSRSSMSSRNPNIRVTSDDVGEGPTIREIARTDQGVQLFYDAMFKIGNASRGKLRVRLLWDKIRLIVGAPPLDASAKLSPGLQPMVEGALEDIFITLIDASKAHQEFLKLSDQARDRIFQPLQKSEGMNHGKRFLLLDLPFFLHQLTRMKGAKNWTSRLGIRVQNLQRPRRPAGKRVYTMGNSKRHSSTRISLGNLAVSTIDLISYLP